MNSTVRWWIATVGLAAAIAGCDPPKAVDSGGDSARREHAGTKPAAALPVTKEQDKAEGTGPRTGATTENEHAGGSDDAGTPSAPAVTATDSGGDISGWPKPDLALVFTGRQHGYIEPCGCTGLANQKGGLARRFTALAQLRGRGWPLLLVDCGDQVRRFGPQAEIKFHYALRGMRAMGYDVAVIAPNDLRLPATMLAGELLPQERSERPLFVCGDMSLFGDESFLPAVQVVQAGGKRIGVTSVSVGPARDKVASDDVEVRSVEETLKTARARMQKAKVDLRVCVLHGPAETAGEIAGAWPELDLVVCTGEPGEPAPEIRRVGKTDTRIVLVGEKGMFITVVGLTWNQDAVAWKYGVVVLDASFKDARPMLDLLADYQNTLKQRGLEALGARPVAHPSGFRFVGSAACAECHEDEYRIWKEGADGKGGPHAHATESLVRPGERSEIPRHFDPECLSCHVTGWNPQRFYPYVSGYVALEASKHLHGNGCENCHGPGSEHVAAENGDIDVSEERLKALQEAMQLPLARARDRCIECHDLDNSPDFHLPGAFEKYWKRIEH